MGRGALRVTISLEREFLFLRPSGAIDLKRKGSSIGWLETLPIREPLFKDCEIR